MSSLERRPPAPGWGIARRWMLCGSEWKRPMAARRPSIPPGGACTTKLTCQLKRPLLDPLPPIRLPGSLHSLCLGSSFRSLPRFYPRALRTTDKFLRRHCTPSWRLSLPLLPRSPSPAPLRPPLRSPLPPNPQSAPRPLRHLADHPALALNSLRTALSSDLIPDARFPQRGRYAPRLGLPTQRPCVGERPCWAKRSGWLACRLPRATMAGNPAAERLGSRPLGGPAKTRFHLRSTR
jgi:hypothetical protein